MKMTFTVQIFGPEAACLSDRLGESSLGKRSADSDGVSVPPTYAAGNFGRPQQLQQSKL